MNFSTFAQVFIASAVRTMRERRRISRNVTRFGGKNCFLAVESSAFEYFQDDIVVSRRKIMRITRAEMVKNLYTRFSFSALGLVGVYAHTLIIQMPFKSLKFRGRDVCCVIMLRVIVYII